MQMQLLIKTIFDLHPSSICMYSLSTKLQIWFFIHSNEFYLHLNFIFDFSTIQIYFCQIVFYMFSNLKPFLLNMIYELFFSPKFNHRFTNLINEWYEFQMLALFNVSINMIECFFFYNLCLVDMWLTIFSLGDQFYRVKWVPNTFLLCNLVPEPKYWILDHYLIQFNFLFL